LREFCDKNYNQLLPILAEKMHQEKVQQEKLKAVKAHLNSEETSQYFESGAPSRRRRQEKTRTKSSSQCVLTPELHESAGGLLSLKLSLHSCSLPGSTNAMGIETSIALVLPDREHECDTSFVLRRPPALS
ncbi:hypothetical protein Tco_0921379, partial [Tanacetum coccineum]